MRALPISLYSQPIHSHFHILAIMSRLLPAEPPKKVEMRMKCHAGHALLSISAKECI